MKRFAILLLLAAPLYSMSLADWGAAVGLAASAGTIVREGHDLVTNFPATMKRHGKQIAAAAKGQPKPVDPAPVPFTAHVPETADHEKDYRYPKGSAQ